MPSDSVVDDTVRLFPLGLNGTVSGLSGLMFNYEIWMRK